MEIQDFARRILLTPSLSEKLAPPEGPFTDKQPGDPCRLEVPQRPADLQFAPRRSAPAMPRPAALHDPQKRAVAHHIMANHELQALEVMAWTLLAFPDAPRPFREDVAGVMRDEQRHTRMHIERARRLGLRFGELPVNSYIWGKAMQFEKVLDYIAGLPLVFEGRNLDHSLELASAFDSCGDARSSAVMRVIHEDEIDHVAVGMHWLRKLKDPAQSDWEAFVSHLHWPLQPAKARGEVFQRTARERAGMASRFIDQLEHASLEPRDPSNTP